MNNYQDDIAKTWDNINECLVDKTKAISHEDFMRAKEGELKISLAGIKTVPIEWIPDLNGKNVLALACGGGQQAPVFEIINSYEDCDGGGFFDKYMNSYVAVRAIKK